MSYRPTFSPTRWRAACTVWTTSRGTGKDGGHGVVLVSYTWGDDSSKYLAVKDPGERLGVILRSLQPCAADFVSALQDAIVPNTLRLVDWQDRRGYYGAFKVNYPGQDQYNQDSYYHVFERWSRLSGGR